VKYTAPEMNVVMFETEEVIVASTTTSTQSVGEGGSEDV